MDEHGDTQNKLTTREEKRNLWEENMRNMIRRTGSEVRKTVRTMGWGKSAKHDGEKGGKHEVKNWKHDTG